MELLKLFSKSENNAPKVLERYSKLRAAIRVGARNLSSLIDDLLSARKGLATAEVSDVLDDEAKPEAVSLATSRVSEAEKTLTDEAARIDRLRGGAVGLASEVWAERCRVKEALPGHAAAIRQAFAIEWGEALEKFQLVLNRRAGLEQILGPLDLPEPAVGCVSESAALSADRAPWSTFEQLELIVAEILAPRRLAAEIERYPAVPAERGGHGRKFDSQGIYVLARAAEGHEIGARVIEKSLSPNLLRWLFNIGDALPYVEATGQADLTILQAEEAAQAEAQAAIDRKLAREAEPKPAEISEERRRWLEWNDYSFFGRKATR